jgi:hypothetical protein
MFKRRPRFSEGKGKGKGKGKGEGMLDLDRFDKEAQPEKFGGRGYDMAKMPDGEYAFTCLEAQITQTPKTRDTILKMELRIESGDATGKTTEKAWFLTDQKKFNQMLGDLLILGFDTDKWSVQTGRLPSKELPAAILRMKGLRFRANKENSAGGDGKTYANLTMLGRVGDIPAPSTNQSERTKDVPF